MDIQFVGPAAMEPDDLGLNLLGKGSNALRSSKEFSEFAGRLDEPTVARTCGKPMRKRTQNSVQLLTPDRSKIGATSTALFCRYSFQAARERPGASGLARLKRCASR